MTGPCPDDAHFMDLALAEAARARGFTRPNPMVGAVIVRDGEVLATGFHRRAGLPHAEVEALQAAARAGIEVRGATMYVTLEPCSHFGRTPPCADTLIDAGLATVVAGMVDPNPVVAGRGLQRLRDHGIAVRTGVREAECRRLNEGFIMAMTEGRPFITVKLAMSLDGRVATRTGSSQWISGAEARAWAHRLRADSDAILVGTGTLLIDNPRLTVRLPEGPADRQPHRYALDARLQVPLDAALLDTTVAPTTLFHARDAPQERQRALRERDHDLHCIPRDPERGGLIWAPMLALMIERGQQHLLVEGGAHVVGSLFDAGLVDRLYCVIAPKIIGGSQAPAAVAGLGVGAIEDAHRAHRMRWEPLGEDLLVVADFREDGTAPG
jgi:diaminohydroxyphosphoribosylaminopyrimidine deaminase/5-amino-6-(5-phosphoribosylamino)uracil reductase